MPSDEEQQAEQQLKIAHGRIAYLEDMVRGLQSALASSESLVFSHEGHIVRIENQLKKLEREAEKASFVAGQIPLDLDNDTLRRALIRAIDRQTSAETRAQLFEDVSKEIERAALDFSDQMDMARKKLAGT
jgi:hypothetical protein